MLTDLGSVTRTIKNLISQELLTNNLVPSLNVTAAPPDPAQSAPNFISVYLYHIVESPEFRNLPPESGGSGLPVPVQQAPMGVIMQYIISVLHRASDDLDVDTQTEQKLIGFIARTFHDFPVISDQTRIGPTGDPLSAILDGDLADQEATIRLILRPAPTEETVAFWAAQQQHVARLSLFVEARVIVLEPKPPVTLPGVTLSLGTIIFPGAGPQLATTSGITWFLVPAALGSDLRALPSSPAQVALFPLVPRTTTPADVVAQINGQLKAIAALDPDVARPDKRTLQNNTLTLEGTSLAPFPGSVTLVLQRDDFSVQMSLDSPPPENAPWAISLSATKISLQFRQNVLGMVSQNGLLVAQDTELVPGAYTARLLVADASSQGRARGSNQISFLLNPQVISILPAPGSLYNLQVAGNYLNDAGLDIDLAVGGQPLTPPAVSAPMAAGNFALLADGATIQFQLPASLPVPTPASPLPVRLLVNGATASPAWITQATGP
jgi:hypothetical protein